MFVYIVRAEVNGLVKIGTSRDPMQRFRDLLTANPGALTLLRLIEGGHSVEGWMHRHFSALRVDREWFRFDAEMLDVQPPIEEESRGSKILGDESTRKEMRECIRVITADLHPRTTVKERFSTASERCGLKSGYCKRLFYLEVPTIPAFIADRLRELAGLSAQSRIVELEREVEHLRAHAFPTRPPRLSSMAAGQGDLLALFGLTARDEL